ncbi:hypothetical protein NDU88_004548 [Pleurodeles waltl]|uniref:Uncharacterized protein n=1 Tax=Pleurodeles waltl TaxID=8319 RepID=A0AAV7VJ21_PLEWA|nr:hypothetical protein NDU88_004548 [Pleurodeles waltl]
MPRLAEGRVEMAGARERRPGARLWVRGAGGVGSHLGQRALPCAVWSEECRTSRWRRSRGDALSLAPVGGPGLVRVGPSRQHNRPALYSSGTEEKEEAQSARCTGRKTAM